MPWIDRIQLVEELGSLSEGFQVQRRRIQPLQKSRQNVRGLRAGLVQFQEPAQRFLFNRLTLNLMAVVCSAECASS